MKEYKCHLGGGKKASSTKVNEDRIKQSENKAEGKSTWSTPKKARLRVIASAGIIRIFTSFRSEGWWRRGESNPRPEILHLGLYIRSPNYHIRP
jgi:hypothetical protein